MESRLKVTPTIGTLLSDAHPYLRLIGKLIYLTIMRLYITFHVHLLSLYMYEPTNAHMYAAQKLLCYLVGNLAHGTLLTSSFDVATQAYSDNDWADSSVTRRSTSGFCLLLGKSLVNCKNKKQNVVTRSTAEAQS